MVTIAMVWPTALVAAGDPSIKGQLRADIQASMREFIDSRTEDGGYLSYDVAQGKLLTLKFKELHNGIVKKGDLYVSCADFTDSSGRLFDLDFLVRPVGDKLQTSQRSCMAWMRRSEPITWNLSRQPVVSAVPRTISQLRPMVSGNLEECLRSGSIM